MKKMFLIVMFLMITTMVFGADNIISIKIPEAKIAKALEGFLAIYPNSEMTDDEPPVAKWTTKQWVSEKLRRILVRDIRRGLQLKANQAAIVEPDDDVAVIE